MAQMFPRLLCKLFTKLLTVIVVHHFMYNLFSFQQIQQSISTCAPRWRKLETFGHMENCQIKVGVIVTLIFNVHL